MDNAILYLIVLMIPFIFIFLTMAILVIRQRGQSARLEQLRQDEKDREEFVQAEIKRRRGE